MLRLLLCVLGGLVGLTGWLPAQAPDLLQVAGNPALWPREVTLRTAITVPIVHNGREAGSVPLPAGRTLKVRKVEATRVTLELNGSTVTVAPSQTDLIQRVLDQHWQRSGSPAVPAGAPTIAPTPLAQPPTPTPSPPPPTQIPAANAARTRSPAAVAATAASTAPPAKPAAAVALPTTPGWHRRISLPALPKSPQTIPGVQGDLQPAAESFDLYLPKDFDPRQACGLIVYVSPADNPDIPERYAELWDQHRLIVIGAYRSGNNEKVERRAGLAVSAQLALKGHYAIDPKRVFASGMSGGGRMSTRLGLMAPQYFKGVLAHCGADFYKDYHVTQKTAQGKREWQGRYWPAFSGNQHATPASVVQSRSETRFVLLSGPNDTARNHEDWEAALKADGFKVLLVMEPGLGHAFCNLESYRRGLEFVLTGK